MNETGRGRIRVEISQELEQLVSEYLEARRRECAAIEQLLHSCNVEEIRWMGHHMKGSGGSFGFDDISEIGEALENAAQESDVAGIRSAADRLERYLERVAVKFV